MIDKLIGQSNNLREWEMIDKLIGQTKIEEIGK